MAWLGEKCSHVTSVLFCLEASMRLKEAATVTRKPAFWKMPASKKKIEYKQMLEIDFRSSKKKKKDFERKQLQMINLQVITLNPSWMQFQKQAISLVYCQFIQNILQIIFQSVLVESTHCCFWVFL